MKTFFEIIEGKKSSTIKLFTRKQQMDADTNSVAVQIRKDQDDKWCVSGFIMVRPSRDNSLIIRALGMLEEKAFKSPISLLEALESDGGKQIVWDDRLKKFRNISTMQDDDDRYLAVGTNISVKSETEELAERRLVSAVAKAMMRNPEDAAELSEWFSGGRKIKVLESGEVPGFPLREIFANKGETAKVKKKITVKSSKK